jgi:preprotein translocase subunit SecG
MGILFGIVIFVYVIVCLFLCLLVLIQSDKGGGISGALGGGLAGASSLLGTQDTKNILTRGTTLFATLFMGLSILISLVLAHGAAESRQKSVLKDRAEKQESYSPASILQEGSMPIASGEGAGGLDGEVLPQEAPAGEIPIAPGGDAPAGEETQGDQPPPAGE